MSFSRIVVALFAALVFVPAAWADGNVFINGQLNFGSTNWTAGSSNFFFGNPQGGAAIFTGGAETPNGSSRISGEVGLMSNTFVPQGTKGTGNAGGNLSFNYDALHHNGGFKNGNEVNVNTWSNSSGAGSANSNVFHRGNTQQWSNAGKG